MAALLLVAACGLTAAGGAILLLRAAQRRAALQHAFLAEGVALLEGGRIAPTPSGYGVLRGRWRSHEAALTPIAEALAFRRLPQLWIVVTLKADAGLDAAFEALRRPTGAEFFAAGGGLPRAFAPPPDWPQDTALRGEPEAESALPRIAEALAPTLAEPRCKALLAGPSGVRLVWQAAQGRRGAYLLFRDLRFDMERLPAGEIEALLDRALGVAGAIRAASAGGDHAQAA
ncbi:hypothetical protein HNR47_002515 [Methylopila jiangsuensis]|nr:hypothetical protein [Methylopila jiangsuensis]MDR6286494.1 hypothetical protein [Methylopila jiangsuensis]